MLPSVLGVLIPQIRDMGTISNRPCQQPLITLCLRPHRHQNTGKIQKVYSPISMQQDRLLESLLRTQYVKFLTRHHRQASTVVIGMGAPLRTYRGL